MRVLTEFNGEALRIPIKDWTNGSAEEETYAQAANLTKLPFTKMHVALMPDAHPGMGMPIGGVVACDGYIIPNAVGSDIGCGMLSRRFNAKAPGVKEVKEVIGALRDLIPVGFKSRTEIADSVYDKVTYKDLPVLSKEEQNIQFQLGTLGGGELIATGMTKNIRS